MNRVKKEKMVSFRLTKEALEILARVSKEKGISQTAAVELAIRKTWGKNDPGT